MAKKKLYAQRRTFTPKEEIASNIDPLEGKPTPREVKSQVAQIKKNQPGIRKDVKMKMGKKLN